MLFSWKKLLHSLDRGTGIWYSPRTPEASPVLVEADETCGRGGIGRRAALRSLWANPRGSSSLLDRTIPSYGDYDTKKALQRPQRCGAFLFFGPQVWKPRDHSGPEAEGQ